ncbi:MAG TPA: hypothetical protein VFW46_01855 [Stellaceae bacterium]|nr:hypothetical protein [Stellaceae bacterium]
MDRLPWLQDEPAPPRKRGGNRREAAALAVVAALLVAGASYWMGGHGWQRPATTEPLRPSTTVALPRPRAAESAQPQVALEAPPQVIPAPEREVPIARPRGERRSVQVRRQFAHEAPSTAEEQKPSASPPNRNEVAQPAKPAPAAAYKPLTVWPAWQSQGAYGRIVRIGAFGSRLQAKLGWRYMVQAYPAVAHLQATVVEARNSHGRPFYRFQIGTTSQAHSEVLCQRMQKIRWSCAVVGLPWKPKGVER